MPVKTLLFPPTLLPFFTKNLSKWNENQNIRQMPWKGEKDPYKIWLSEIILQQTRVQQGLNYYENFIKSFPDIKKLADAPEEQVFKLWEGLGYYTRCKNLIVTAKYIADHLDGVFPEEYENILSLKGIGPYTASAIASFAYNKPYAVLDGNVFRVISRYLGIEIPINTTEGKKVYAKFAEELLDKKNPAKYNQAIMDFGATICKPALPLCLQCPLQKKCVAFREDKVDKLPINEKVIKQRTRYLNYLIVKFDHQYYVRKRSEKDIWENLFEFILIETPVSLEPPKIQENETFLKLFKKTPFNVTGISPEYSQKLTHQKINARFFHITISSPLPSFENYFLATDEEIDELPFPKTISAYLREKKVSLNLTEENN